MKFHVVIVMQYMLQTGETGLSLKTRKREDFDAI